MSANITALLESKFVQSSEVARALELALAAQKNLLLWGPAGHGKSEMVTAGLAAQGVEPFVQSCGEGLDEATLWGGLDFAALEREKVLRYFPENSFLAHEVAIFEELFDAPASVLLSLKDTLTARVLRKGSQRFAMTTRVVIAITNKDPEEISSLGPAAHALVERFPLQLKVEWASYSAADYAALFSKVCPQLPGADLGALAPILAEMMAKASENAIISPRSAVHAVGVVKAAAALRGAHSVGKQDLLDLRFIDGMEDLAASLREEIEAATARALALSKIAQLESRLEELREALDAAEGNGSPIKCLKVAKLLHQLGDDASQVAVPDGLVERRKSVREAAPKLAARAQESALRCTR